MSMNFSFLITRLFYCCLVILMSSCSGVFVDNKACCINGNLDYLKADLLCEIFVPDDLMLPFVDQEYNVPNMVCEKGFLNVGKKVNICPPNIEY